MVELHLRHFGLKDIARNRFALPALKVAVLSGVVLLVALLPRFVAGYRVGELTYVGIWFVALVGLNILTGYNGQISLGHGAFMMVGAYTAALLTLGRPGLADANVHPPSWLPIGHGMQPVFTIPIAALVTGVIGFAFGFPALRLAGVSLALATFALAVSMPMIAKHFENVTGGGGGLNLPQPKTPFGLHASADHWLYYEAWATAGVFVFIAWLLVRGRVGRAWRAIRDGEIAAVSSGVAPATYKTLAFGVSSAFAGAAGALLAIQVSYVNPDTFPLSKSILLLACVVVGGLASLSGVIFGALLMEYLPIYAQQIYVPVVGLDFGKEAPGVVFGAVLVFCMFVMPGGVAGVGKRIVAGFKGALRG